MVFINILKNGVIMNITKTSQTALRTFETDVELRSFVIRFQNVAKKLKKIPYFVVSSDCKTLNYYLVSISY
mgnify:CR=1 FL=1